MAAANTDDGEQKESEGEQKSEVCHSESDWGSLSPLGKARLLGMGNRNGNAGMIESMNEIETKVGQSESIGMSESKSESNGDGSVTMNASMNVSNESNDVMSAGNGNGNESVSTMNASMNVGNDVMSAGNGNGNESVSKFILIKVANAVLFECLASEEEIRHFRYKRKDDNSKDSSLPALKRRKL